MATAANSKGIEKSVSRTVTVKNGTAAAVTTATTATTPALPPVPTQTQTPKARCDTTAQAIVNAVGGCGKIDQENSPDGYAACCKSPTKPNLLQILNDALVDGTIDKTEKALLLSALNAYLSGAPMFTPLPPLPAKPPDLTVTQQPGWGDDITAGPYSLEALFAQQEKADVPIHVGDDVMIHWNVVNDGIGPTEKGIAVAVYVDGVFIRTITSTSPLDAGGVRKLREIIKVPKAGTHTFGIVVDPDDAIAESNEMNNDFYRSFIVSENGVQLCADINYGGGCELFTGKDSDLRDNSIGNDRVSSIIVPDGVTVALMDAIDYGGNCETFTSNSPDFRNEPIGNDVISSIAVGYSCSDRTTSGGGDGSTCSSNQGTLSLSMNSGSRIYIDGYVLRSSGNYSFDAGYTYGCYGYGPTGVYHQCQSVTIRACQTTNSLIRWDP
ncbi:MAG: hypothetical protein A3H76_01420 [Candidatus Lloydbacteria bacterium RIFCSPLOWO2_02_FULL_54_12]|nr:MAG: hypothetical protein A3H76_01420 [Candidatus Lloydbacteria bacterium RIFCSPLOWO2_02_FULL_54_12]